MKTTPIDLSGQRFGRLTVSSRVGRKWICSCDCGESKNVPTADLTRGRTKSCGCLRSEEMKARLTKHGATGERVYRIWKGMWSRCSLESQRGYQKYKSRVPPVEWRYFSVFLKDMGPPPSDLHSLERQDNSLPYSKDNCVWATCHEQSRNTTRNIDITKDGVTKCISDWADGAGIKRATLDSRLKLGWSFDKAISTPPRALRGRNC